jgi:hypothetical protein
LIASQPADFRSQLSPPIISIFHILSLADADDAITPIRRLFSPFFFISPFSPITLTPLAIDIASHFPIISFSLH